MGTKTVVTTTNQTITAPLDDSIAAVLAAAGSPGLAITSAKLTKPGQPTVTITGGGWTLELVGGSNDAPGVSSTF